MSTRNSSSDCDWRSKVDDFISDLLHQKATLTEIDADTTDNQDTYHSACSIDSSNGLSVFIDQSIQKAVRLLDLIEEDSLFVKEDLISIILDVLRNDLFHHNYQYEPIIHILQSQSFDPVLKMNVIRFINLIVSKFTVNENENIAESKMIYEVLCHKEVDNGIDYFRGYNSGVKKCNDISNGGNNDKVDVDDDEIKSMRKKLNPFWQNIMDQIQKEKQSIKNNATRTSSSSSSSSSSNSSSNNRSSRDTSDADTIKAYGDYFSKVISTSAMFLSNSISKNVVPIMTDSIEHVGEFAKRNIDPHVEESKTLENTKNKQNEKDKDRNVELTNATVNVTNEIRKSSKAITHGIRDHCTQGINKVVEKWEENEVGKQLCPEPELREAFAFAGKVSMATLGASVTLAEAMFEATKAAAQTSIKVTADVSQHTYGGSTGKIVENTGTTAGNILSSIAHVAMLEGKVLSKAIVKNTAKVNMDSSSSMEKLKEDAEEGSSNKHISKKNSAYV